MKKVFLLILLISTVIFSGCARAVQLSEKLLVQGMGIDYKNNEYVITLQTINSKETSNEKSSTPKKIKTITSSGETIKEASYNIIKQTGKEPLYSQTLILLLGKGTIEQGINKFIDFFVRHHEFSPDTRVLVTEHEAIEVLNLKEDDEIISSEDILAMLEEGPNKSKKLHSNIESIIGDLKDKNSFVKISLLDIKREQGKNVLTIEKLGIFKEDKYLACLDKNETKGALIVRGKAKNMVDTIDSKNFRNVSYTISKLSSKSKIEVKNDGVEINIKINLEADVNESENKISKKDFGEIEREISGRVKELCSAAIEKAIFENGCDIFEFSKMLIKEKPDYKQEQEEKIIQRLKSANYKIEVKSKVCAV